MPRGVGLLPPLGSFLGELIMKKKKLIRHLKGDIKMFKHEAQEDRSLMKSLGSLGKKKKKASSKKKKDSKKSNRYKDKYSRKAEDKINKVMHEFGQGELHSGSKKGPKVKSRKQAIAIGIAEARRKGLKAGRRPKKKK